MKRAEERSEWWAVDGDMLEIGDHVPPLERFVIPLENIPNKRRKLKESSLNTKKRLKCMVEPDENCETRVEDVAWLCSLSESEIDMLISLKVLIIQHAKRNDRNELAKKFTLKMIRAIALILMEHFKTEIKDSSLIPNSVKSTDFLDGSNLLKCNNEFDADIDALSAVLGTDMEKLLGRSRRPQYQMEYSKDQNFGRNRQSDSWEKVNLRDKFEYDRENKMREKD